MRKILKIFTLICIYISVFSTISYAGFEDIKGHWCEKEILNFYESKFVEGYEDATFRPDNEITRAELCKIVNAYMNYEVSGEWQEGNMRTAEREGYLLTGEANDFMSREEAFVVLARAMKLEMLEYDLVYNDVEEIGIWAVPAVKTLTFLGYVNGYDTNELKAKQNITRAEVVKVLHDFVGIGGLDEEIEEVEFAIGYLVHNNYGLEFVKIDNAVEVESGETVMLAATVSEEDVKFNLMSGEECVEFDKENLILEAIQSGEVVVSAETSKEKKTIVIKIK